MVEQHVRDAADAGNRVGAVIQRRIVGNWTAVEQVLGVARCQAEQADYLGPRGEAVRGLRVLDTAGCKRTVLQGIRDSGETFLLDVVRGDNRQRLSRFLLGLGNQRSGDDHLLQGLGLLLRAVGIHGRRGCVGGRGRVRVTGAEHHYSARQRDRQDLSHLIGHKASPELVSLRRHGSSRLAPVPSHMRILREFNGCHQGATGYIDIS